LAEAYNNVVGNSLENYYSDLNHFLIKKYPKPLLRIKKNLIGNIGYVDPNQKGIYNEDTGVQIGKLEVIIQNGTIKLEHIKAFEKGHGLTEKILEHMKEYAAKNNLSVEAEIVSDLVGLKFDKIFQDWNVSKEGDIVRASLKGSE
jgi:hypothetical protein